MNMRQLKRRLSAASGGLAKLGEVIGVVTAALFLVSAGANAVWMSKTLGLNYFAVASTEDVVMQGVRTFGVATLFTLINLAFQLFATRQFRAGEVRRIKSVRHNPYSNPGEQLRIHKYDLAALQKLQAVVMLPILAGFFLFMTFASMTDALRLTINSDDVPPPCRQGEVKWMGSRSIVADCQGSIFVLRDYENVALKSTPKATCPKQWNGVRRCPPPPPIKR